MCEGCRVDDLEVHLEEELRLSYTAQYGVNKGVLANSVPQPVSTPYKQQRCLSK